MRLNHDCVRDVMLFIEEEQELGMALHLPDFLMKNARKSPYFNAGMDRAKLT